MGVHVGGGSPCMVVVQVECVRLCCKVRVQENVSYPDPCVPGARLISENA